MRLLTYVALLFTALLVVACGRVESANPQSQVPSGPPTSAPTAAAVAQSTAIASVPPTSAPTAAVVVQATQAASAPPSGPTTAVADQPVTVTPSSTQPVSSDVVVIYRKSGGFAGVNETMTVHRDGTVELLGKDRQIQQVQVASADVASLTQLLSSNAFMAVQSSSHPAPADAFIYEITVPSAAGKQHTIRTAEGGDQAPALKQALGALARLREQIK